MFEFSKWIACADYRNQNGSYLLRRNFFVNKSVKSVVMRVCGLGLGVYTVNGNKVTDDVLVTPFTKYDSRVYFNTYDITHLISIGGNVVGVHLGNGFYNDNNPIWEFSTATWKDHPKLLMEIEITDCDNNTVLISSDKEWKAIPGPSVYNHMREGECFDNRLYQKGWDIPDFDDSSWQSVFYCKAPGGILEENIFTPIKRINILHGKELENQIYDFGENTSGYVHIKGTAPEGTELIIEYSERYVDGDIDTKIINCLNKNELKHEDKYIFSGDGIEEWEPSFVYHGFRYVKLHNAPKDIQIYAVTVHTDLNTIGEFETSDPMLNKIHAASRRSTLTNYHGIPTDCPHREQNGWTGDACWSAEQSLMNFNMSNVYKKWMLDFKDVQRPSGQIPSIIPTSGWGYNWGSGPAWDSAMILIPWYTYNITGDKSLISLMWTNIKKYLRFMDSMADDNILGFGLWDWCAADESNVCSREATDTAYYYCDYFTAAKIADALMVESKPFYKKADAIKKSFRSRFLSDDKNLNNQTFLSVCIYFGLLEENEYQPMADKLAKLTADCRYHILGGTIGTKCFFSALSEHGYADIVYKTVTNPDYPSYAYWINSGMTTFCENWDMSSSLNHHMFSEVDYWFYKYVAGFKLNEGKLKIKPCKIEELTTVKASYKDVFVEIEGDILNITLSEPTEIVWGSKKYILDKGKHSISGEEKI